MGGLHDGHLSLCSAAVNEGCELVGSVFVNPAQFAPGEDFAEYPRSLEEDIEKFGSAGAKAVFMPTDAVMYPKAPPFRTYVDPQEANDEHEGAKRPGFFRGVATVVTKLFGIVQPDMSFFGQKDAYQCVVVKQLARDLNLPVDIRIVPISREKDGLAMSTRNQYLSPEQRAIAPALFASLEAARAAAEAEPVRSVGDVVSGLQDALRETEGFDLQYAVGMDAVTGRSVPAERAVGQGAPVVLAAAVGLGEVRILDNVVVGGGPEDIGGRSRTVDW